MSINATNLAAAYDLTNRTATSYVTGNISFVKGRLYMLTIRGRTATTAPLLSTVTGGGNTWLLLETVNISNVSQYLYYCVAASTTTATISFTPDGITSWTQGGWIVDEFANVSASPILQSEQNSDPNSHSSLTVTLAAFAGPNNVAYGAFSQNEDTAITPGSGFTGLGAAAESVENVNRLRSMWRRGQDTSVDVTTATTASDIFGVAVEIAVGDVERIGSFVINDMARGNIYYR